MLCQSKRTVLTRNQPRKERRLRFEVLEDRCGPSAAGPFASPAEPLSPADPQLAQTVGDALPCRPGGSQATVVANDYSAVDACFGEIGSIGLGVSEAPRSLLG